MDSRLTVAIGDRVVSVYGDYGYVSQILDGGLTVVVTRKPEGGYKVGDFHPTKVRKA